jgi:hypothetical protein
MTLALISNRELSGNQQVLLSAVASDSTGNSAFAFIE